MKWISYGVLLIVGLFAVLFVNARTQSVLSAIRAQEQASSPLPTPDPAQVAAAREAVLARQAQRRADSERFARMHRRMLEEARAIKAEAAKPKPEPTPMPAYSFAAPGPALMPLEGWVDQPNKDKPGRVHTNLRIRNVAHAGTAGIRPGEPPCFVKVRKQPERLYLRQGGGYIDILEPRDVSVPCR